MEPAFEDLQALRLLRAFWQIKDGKASRPLNRRVMPRDKLPSSNLLPSVDDVASGELSSYRGPVQALPVLERCGCRQGRERSTKRAGGTTVRSHQQCGASSVTDPIDRPDKTAVPVYDNINDVPTIYFDIAPAYGVMSGIVQIELGARILVPHGDDSVDVRFISSGRLL